VLEERLSAAGAEADAAAAAAAAALAASQAGGREAAAAAAAELSRVQARRRAAGARCRSVPVLVSGAASPERLCLPCLRRMSSAGSLRVRAGVARRHAQQHQVLRAHGSA
jgi:hypothetical protein